MTAYVKMVRDFVRGHIVGNDAGQNMVETALIIGTVSLVLVAAFIASDIDGAMLELGNRVICNINGTAQDGYCPGAPAA